MVKANSFVARSRWANRKAPCDLMLCSGPNRARCLKPGGLLAYRVRYWPQPVVFPPTTKTSNGFRGSSAIKAINLSAYSCAQAHIPPDLEALGLKRLHEQLRARLVLTLSERKVSVMARSQFQACSPQHPEPCLLWRVHRLGAAPILNKQHHKR